MSTNNAHIIIVDGFPSSGKKLFGLELAITLMYNDQKTAILLPSSSPLRTIIENRKKTHPFLPSPDIIERSNFNLETKNYDAILIPGIPPSDELASNVESKIIEASEKVYNAEFNINPKQLKGKNIGCKYCKYKYICYMKHDNIEKLD